MGKLFQTTNLFSLKEAVLELYGLTGEIKRSQWVKSKLSSLPANSTILDIGAGQQPYRQYCEHVNYKSQDFAKYKPGEYLGEGLQHSEWDYKELDYECDATNIPIASSSFDNVLCTEVLEHVPEPALVLKECLRLTKPSGLIFVTVPQSSLPHMLPYCFYSGFTIQFFRHFASANDSRLLEYQANGGPLDLFAQELYRYLVYKRKKRIIRYLVAFLLSPLFLMIYFVRRGCYSNEREHNWNLGWHIVLQRNA